MIDHEKNLRKAIELSKQSIDSGSSPFGCVIVDAEGKIVGEGHNGSHLTTIRRHTAKSSPSATPAATSAPSI